MARQLVFTSAPQGLTPGRTGYCTVARPRDLRDRLATAMESLSVYPSDWQPAPVVCTFRIVDLGGTRFPVLSRIVNAGQDYTHRGHFLAHHLALDPEEISGAPSPAEIFRRWPGWRNQWDGPPRWLDEKDWVDLTALRISTPPAVPAETWARLTGDAGRAALLVEGLNPVNRVLRCPVELEGESINLLCESSALLPSAESWSAEFTTCLQTSDTASSFRWAFVRAGSPAEAVAPRSGGILDLTQPSLLPSAPDNILARRARGTIEKPAQPQATLTPREPVTAPRAAVVPMAEILRGEQPRPTPPRPMVSPNRTRARSNRLVFAALGGFLACGVILAAVFWPRNSSQKPAATPDLPPPVSFSSPSNSPAETAAGNGNKIIPPTLTASNPVMKNEQAINDIMQLITEHKAMDALAQWKELSATAPEFSSAHIDVLNIRLLPQARKDWLAALEQITTDLNSGETKLADLDARLAALRDFPKNWPVSKPDELDREANAVAAMLNFLEQLPGAPVWVVDNLASAGNSSDYKAGTITLKIPELSALLAAGPGKFQVSAAPATSLQPPAPGEWFNFNILPADFEAGSFLVLHDASRGQAGGRFLELLPGKAGEVKLTWRMFQANSDFFRRFPTNAPLRPVSREFWLRFVGEPPLPSCYLLLRRLGDVTGQTWNPLTLPQSWLKTDGAPAKVSLPNWLANRLVVHATPGQSFRLEPMNLNPATQTLTVVQTSADTIAKAEYQASKLISELNDKYRALQTEAERAQQLLNKITSDPDPKRLPPQVVIDQAAQTVKKLQASLAQVQATTQAAGNPNWPLSVAPWLLYGNPTANETMVYLKFTPNETGPTP